MRKFFLLCITLLAPCILHAEIHEHGFWLLEEPGHVFDEPVAKAITEYLKKEDAKTCVDMGAGDGSYVKYFNACGIVTDGYDGNPHSPALSDNLVKVADLSQPVNLEKTYDWVLSLEVGEHIPAQYEAAFIDNLDRHNTKGIILSWAVEGQGGYGHFNCRNNDYIKKVMASHGYVNDVDAENAIRSVAVLSWFKNTIMVFRKT
jgi:hypothetical protein